MSSSALVKPVQRRPRRPKAVDGASRRLMRGGIGLVVLGIALEAVTRAGFVNEDFLPPASSILTEAGHLLLDSEFQRRIMQTLTAWSYGLLLAALLAVPVGVLLGSSAFAYRAARTVIELIRPIPSIALIPLAILLFGNGIDMKVSLAVYASVWPILFNTIYGVHDVDPVAKATARVFGFHPLSIVARVTLVSAAPFIATGVRLASSVALVVVISAELVGGGGRGIGGYIAAAGASGTQAKLVFAATLVAGLLGLVTNLGMLSLERRVFAWQPDNREDQG